MNSFKTLFFTVAAIAAVGFAWFGWKEFGANRALTAAANASSLQVADLSGRLARAEKHTRELEDQLAQTQQLYQQQLKLGPAGSTNAISGH